MKKRSKIKIIKIKIQINKIIKIKINKKIKIKIKKKLMKLMIAVIAV